VIDREIREQYFGVNLRHFPVWMIENKYFLSVVVLNAKVIYRVCVVFGNAAFDI
jgi:hypothetical protein